MKYERPPLFSSLSPQFFRSVQAMTWTAALALAGCTSLPEFDEVAGNPVAGDGDGDGDGDDDEPMDDINVGMGGTNNGNGDGDGDGDLSNAECGNGEFEQGELCDDGNTDDDDGCNSNCTEVDEDFLCIVAGEACERVVTCGNGVLEGSEPCDDGNTDDDDGCASDCKSVEAGFSCVKPGEACVPVPECGNGLRERGEQCDDGDMPPEDGDGCDADCQEEDPTSWFCPPGSDCIARDCGDGNRTPDEQCDDGGTGIGDGCDADCNVEEGWRCGSSGCREICGDGLMVGAEECDDSDLTSGDGCSSACREEPFYDCNDMPGECDSLIICGDGCVDPGEICDPGHIGSDRNCGQGDSDCKAPPDAQACRGFELTTDPGFCGDGTVNLNEECDADCGSNCDIAGCTACEIDDGWACPGPGYCFKIPECGDGLIQLGEECDPGPFSIAACDDTDCTLNPGYYCEGEPSSCDPSVCGDGFVAKDEQCDDGPGTIPGVPGTPTGGDGCSATCTVEAGYVCPPGLDCQPVCGNGTLEPGEECEETSAGCSNCFITPGYDCDENGINCFLALCGAANTGTPRVDRGEGCDDGNDVAGDGCSPTCQVEPTFEHDDDGTPVNQSDSCGDGFKTLSEGCDDGNQTAGDGCSPTCQEEPGWDCEENDLTYEDSIFFRVTYRDFKATQDTGGHPHFKRNNAFASGTDRGITGQLCTTGNYDPASPGAADCGLLDTDGKPRNMKGLSTTIVENLPAFALWYRDNNDGMIMHGGNVIEMYANPGTTTTPGVPPTIPDTIELQRIGTTSAYELDDESFFDLDGRGFGNTPGQTHNFNFTTELRYFFQYTGGEELIFDGDDDVWVYINGRLAVDVGGIHGPHVGRVVLGDEDGSCNLQTTNGNDPAACTTYTTGEQGDNTDGRFGITKGEVYEIALFHAERNPTGSNFRLTLDGFLAPRSSCETACGDGVRAGNEICDTASTETDGYNICLNDCTINFCGDEILQSPEEFCDDETKVTYQTDGNGCGFDCQRAPYCGDGIIQAFAGEVCDDTVNDGSYGSCTSDCTGFGGYCGDGIKQDEEDCDTAMKVAYQEDGMGCGFDCTWAPYCGDGVRNGPETCEPPNTASCDDTCQIQPFCGDGIVSPGEECDYANFNADPGAVGYGGCTTSCELGPFCGDEVLQSQAGEECDDGDMNSSASSPTYDSCTTACLLGPRCGDGVHQLGVEECDNGFNEDTYAFGPGACGPECTAVPFCGDGIVDPAIEQCDDGMSNNDTAYDGCTTACLWGPYCGDGVQNGSEQCDDPDGNVAYSPDGMGCSFDCTTNVPFCGDGVRNGPEQCDDGEAENTGGYGACNEDCTLGPYCGDGIVQSDQGEHCDAGPSGSAGCLQNCRNRVVVQ